MQTVGQFFPILQAGGQLLGGFSQQSSLNYQAQVARNNSKTSLQNAQLASEAGTSQAEGEGLRVAGQEANTRASIAANNIDANSGSAADVQVSQRELGSEDVSNVESNALIQAYGYKTQATGFQSQASMLHAEADEAPWASLLGAGGSLMSGASNLPDNFSWMGGGGSGTEDATEAFEAAGG